MNTRNLAILAAITAASIFGLNHTIAKGVMPNYVQPYGFILLRVIGASILFWLISFFGPKENIEKKDYLIVLLSALSGMSFNMLVSFKGLALSTPINSAVLITITPIIVLLLSALFLKEKISNREFLGVNIGLIGALGLIFFGTEIRQDAPNIGLGNFLLLLNAIFYGSYLIIAKTLISKYHPFTFMKWLFSLGIFICLPFGYHEVLEIDWANLPFKALLSIGFVILGTTFGAFIFNIFALTQLKASTLSAFIYLQPLIGIVYAVATRQDTFTNIKIAAACFVLSGVYLSSKKPILKNKSSLKKFHQD